MSEMKHTAVALKMVTEGPGWHGPSVQQLLKDVTAEEASTKPATGGACIWELVLHMRAWEREALNGFRGGRVRMQEMTREDDWPPLKDSSDVAWDALKAEINRAHTEMRDLVKKMPAEQLDDKVDSDMGYPLYALIHGMVAHEAYHGGQIGLIKSSLRRKRQNPG